MKSIYFLRIIATIGLVFVFFSGHSHEGHDHGVEEEVTVEELLMSRTEAQDGRYEVLLKFMPVEPGEELIMQIFISEYKSNRPLRVESLALFNTTDAKYSCAITEKEEGIYTVKTIMPEEKLYDMTCSFSINAEQVSMALFGVDFTHHHTGHAAPHEHSHVWMYVVGAGLLVFGLFLGRFTAVRKYRKQVMGSMLLVAIPLFDLEVIHAHEAPNQAAKKSSFKDGQGFELAKESQFLMRVLTGIAGESSYQDGRKLYGTVIPAAGGQSQIVVPQHSRITQLAVRPGQEVAKGAVVAIVERSMDPSNELLVQAERNRLKEEVNRLGIEVERLRQVKDIVSKKELENAEAAYEIAKNNMELYQGDGRSMVLKAPIAGVVSPFTLQVGDYVNSGQTLFTLSNIDKVYIETQAFERDLSMIENAVSFLAQCTDGNHSSGNVRLLSLGSEFNSANQSQKVMFEMDNSNREFKLGEFVNLWVYSDTKANVVAVPNSALTELQGRPAVIVKKSAEVLELRFVAAGHNNGQTTVIQSGLQIGERYVSEGAYQCKLAYLNE
jgi:membrane fusion protein, heavy metal efflux system